MMTGTTLRMGSRRRAVLGVLLASVCGAGLATAQDLAVAAASDLQPVLPAVVNQFQKETGRSVVVTFGSSGNFFSQLENGAPFDVFLSADIDYPRRLEAAGLTEPDTLHEYAVGAIVLWARTGTPVDVRAGLTALLSPAVRRIAIANPTHAPYGRAAVAAFQRAALYDRVQPKLVFGENVSQAGQFVQSGNAEAGILALSLALSPAFRDAGTYYTIPASAYPPIEQGAVVLKSSRHTALATAFLAFFARADIVALLQSSGFAPPPATARPR